MADVADYTALIPSANAQKPNFLAMIEAITQPFVDMINTFVNVPDLMDIDNAIGDQQDILGEWLNMSRTLKAPITGVYFSFGIAGLGLGQGIWHNSSLPLSGVVTLDDGTYRSMLKLKVRANNWDGSLGEANQALVDVFGSQGDPPVVWITDNFDMTLTFHITSESHSAILEQLVTGGYIPFKPMGVAHT